MKTRAPATLALGFLALTSLGAAKSGDTLTQLGWAKLLVQRMALAKNLPVGAGDQAAALLGGRGDSIEKPGTAATLVQADGPQKTWRYDVTTPVAGTWLVTTKNAAPAFVSVDRAPSALTASQPGGAPSDIGRFALLAGAHSLSVHVAQNVAAPDVSIVSGCAVVAPPGGWSPATPATWGVLARTLVQAMHQHGRLPAAEALAISPATDKSFALSVEREGTYTVLLSGHAFDRASYRLDGCEDVHPAATQSADGWREGATVALLPGAHTLAFYGMDAAKPDGRVRLVRRASSDADHLAVLSSLGVKLPTMTASAETQMRADARPTGGVRHAKGDASTSIANRTVTVEEAVAVLDTPGVARLLSSGSVLPNKRKQTGADRVEAGEFGTFEDPISPTVPGGPDAQ